MHKFNFVYNQLESRAFCVPTCMQCVYAQEHKHLMECLLCNNVFKGAVQGGIREKCSILSLNFCL
jgi:hypothetical protein